MFVVTPAFRSIYQSITYEYPDTVSESVQKSYVSANESAMSKDEIEIYLVKNRVLENVADCFSSDSV
jgi:hypothetical protein